MGDGRPAETANDHNPPAREPRETWRTLAAILMAAWGLRWLAGPVVVLLQRPAYGVAVRGAAPAGGAVQFRHATAILSLALALAALSTGVALWRRATAARMAVYVLAAVAACRLLLSLLPALLDMPAASADPMLHTARLVAILMASYSALADAGCALALAWFLRRSVVLPAAETGAGSGAQAIPAVLGLSCLLLLSIEGLQVANLPATLRSVSQAMAGGSPLMLASMASTIPAAIGALVAAALVWRRVAWARGLVVALLCLRLLRVCALVALTSLESIPHTPPGVAMLVGAVTSDIAAFLECGLPLYHLHRGQP